MSSEKVTTEEEQTERVRNQGQKDGLFRACMDQIRTSHTLGQTLRHGALAAGLLTDARCYAELLGQFYVATAALERRLAARRAAEAPLVARLTARGCYSFSSGYESDLRALLGPDWRDTIDRWTTGPAARYVRRLAAATDAELAAAVFILHGPMVIGGGAMLQPRVERAFGADATHVFADVVGSGRAARRRDFIALYDTLLDDDEQGAASFASIVRACGEFMHLNNEMMLAVKRVPWWRKYVAASMVAAAALAWTMFAHHSPSESASASETPSKTS